MNQTHSTDDLFDLELVLSCRLLFHRALERIKNLSPELSQYFNTLVERSLFAMDFHCPDLRQRYSQEDRDEALMRVLVQRRLKQEAEALLGDEVLAGMESSPDALWELNEADPGPDSPFRQRSIEALLNSRNKVVKEQFKAGLRSGDYGEPLETIVSGITEELGW